MPSGAEELTGLRTACSPLSLAVSPKRGQSYEHDERQYSGRDPKPDKLEQTNVLRALRFPYDNNGYYGDGCQRYRRRYFSEARVTRPRTHLLSHGYPLID
jgi:hypothetical protein